MLVLECFLRGIVAKELPFAARCIAAVKIVHSSSEYLARMSLVLKRLQEGCPTTFPQLAPIAQLDFDSNGTLISDYPLIKDASAPHSIHDKHPANPSKRKSNDDSYYQLTLSSQYTTKPEWNEHFVFFIDMLKFNAETSLVIEFYRDPPINETRKTVTDLAIDDLLAYAVVPLGDFSIITPSEQRNIIKLEKVQLKFLGQYNHFLGVDDVTCALDIRVPDGWNQINPESMKPKAVVKPEKRHQSTFRGSFEQLLEMVKQEREAELTAAAAAEESSLEDKEVTFKYSDVEQRQRLIDRLLQELENRSMSIQKLGVDIVGLKERNQKYEDKIKHLESILHEKDVKTNQLLNTIDIKDIPLPELQRRSFYQSRNPTI
ncbi:hypothetical protein BCR33DRAFT_39395 [Rhizoclosmatium globosum]|uniref:C2 domain-containing protein n=1 Tax=Rhizoclosmatium globosum TaxID=329046 RepID=A0A1Y2CNI1_9FUNG|nr:hypothetical protein BCR33DRAFT_39395 [Rhizoclosmatium globosum]|eukprot:ORY48589.1 hypothetical protein BCR33DRAFT_39395 [Rhizoclosmatium globosum]